MKKDKNKKIPLQSRSDDFSLYQGVLTIIIYKICAIFGFWQKQVFNLQSAAAVKAKKVIFVRHILMNTNSTNPSQVAGSCGDLLFGECDSRCVNLTLVGDVLIV